MAEGEYREYRTKVRVELEIELSAPNATDAWGQIDQALASNATLDLDGAVFELMDYSIGRVHRVKPVPSA